MLNFHTRGTHTPSAIRISPVEFGSTPDHEVNAVFGEDCAESVTAARLEALSDSPCGTLEDMELRQVPEVGNLQLLTIKARVSEQAQDLQGFV